MLKRRFISHNLFLGMRTFAPTLVAVNQRVKDVHEVKLLSFNPMHVYSKAEFNEAQATRLREANKELEEVHEQLMVCVDAEME